MSTESDKAHTASCMPAIQYLHFRDNVALIIDRLHASAKLQFLVFDKVCFPYAPREDGFQDRGTSPSAKSGAADEASLELHIQLS